MEESKDLEILVLGRSEYRVRLSRERPEYTIKSTKIGLDIKLVEDEDSDPSSFSSIALSISLPKDIKAGARLYIDFPLKRSLLVELEECHTLGDLVEQIRNVYLEIRDNQETESLGLDPTVNFDNLVIDEIVLCKSGNVVIVVNEQHEDTL
jgi:hypothetical protein